MRKHEKEVEEYLLDEEDEAIKKIQKTYDQAYKDVQKEINKLKAQIEELIKNKQWIENDPEQLEIWESQVRSKIYQQNYQESLKRQIDGFMDALKSEHVKTIEDYMRLMYEDGFLSNIYNLHCRDVPILVPINQELMLKTLMYNVDNIPLSERIYSNVDEAKQAILEELSRGVATGIDYSDIGMNIKNRLGVSFRKAKNIAQNEGQRVKIDARIDSMKAAKAKGADLVKVWDAVYDNKTRPVHRELDQQHAEIDEPFHSSAGDVQAPKKFGRPELDINCRCNLLSVPRWDIEDSIQKVDNISGELIEAENYSDWKKKYYEELEAEEVRQGAERAMKSKGRSRKT